MSLRLIREFSEQYKIDPALILAIGKKESNLNNVDKDGNLIKRYEPHIYRGFYLVSKGRIPKHPALPGLMSDWIKKHSDKQLEMISTSYGIFQIMGYYYPELGYSKIEDLVEDWSVEEVCVHKSLEFMVKYRGGDFLKALQKNDYETIARLWNGTGFKKNNYDTDLKKYHLELKNFIWNEP
jgi:hypothetical protein